MIYKDLQKNTLSSFDLRPFPDEFLVSIACFKMQSF